MCRSYAAGTERPPATRSLSPETDRYPCGATPAKAGLLWGCKIKSLALPLFVQMTLPLAASKAWMKIPMKGQMPAAK